MSGAVAMLAMSPKTIIGATSPRASAVLPARFSAGPNDRKTVLSIKKENATSKIIGMKVGRFSPAERKPARNVVGKKMRPRSARVRGLLISCDGLVVRKSLGIFRAAVTNAITVRKLENMMAGPAQ